MNRPPWLRLRDDLAQDVIYLHEEQLLSPVKIARALGVPIGPVAGTLTDWYAGRRALADALRLAELPPERRSVVRVEAGSSRREDRRAA